MNAPATPRGASPAPDRSGDLHPLQHLRGDVSGRRDHARLAQLRRRRRRCATPASPASRRARPARSTTGASSSAAERVRRSTSSSRWDVLPARGRPTSRRPMPAPSAARTADAAELAAGARAAPTARPVRRSRPGRRAHPYVNLYTQREPAIATVVGNFRVTDAATSKATRTTSCSTSARRRSRCSRVSRSASCRRASTRTAGRITRASIRSPARATASVRGYNNVALTVKRVTVDHAGEPVRGVCSNYLCDLAKGDAVQVIGPFGNTFLMPNHPRVEPADDLHGHRLGADARDDRAAAAARASKDGDGELMLFFGARTAARAAVLRPADEACRRTSSTSTSRSRARPARRSATCRT